MRAISDQELVEALHKSLERAKQRLGARGARVCAKELENILNVLNQTSRLLTTIKLQKPIARRNDDSLFVDIIQILNRILDDVYQEMHSIEVEMRGTRDYLAGEEKRLEHFQYREQLHIEVAAMLRRIMEERPGVGTVIPEFSAAKH